MNAERQKALRSVGEQIPGWANLAKLANSEIQRQQRDIGLRLLGPSGTLHRYESEVSRRDVGSPEESWLTLAALRAQGPSIYGGTDQIQRNIIGERVLGLPREPDGSRQLPFRDVPRPPIAR